MFYYGLRRLKVEERRRAIAGLQRLRTLLDRSVPAKGGDASLLLATWNIRDLTKTRSRRMRESLYYLAETLSRFDFVAVQEVNALEEWDQIVDILGANWAYIASDVCDREAGGNGERLTYLYDRRKLRFQNVAGELVLPESLAIRDDGAGGAARQFARTPYVARFQASWLKFAICTVHLYYGAESGPQLERRKAEIRAVARYFGERADAELRSRDALVLLGDFNIVSPEHETMRALTDNGFAIPRVLQQSPSNALRTKHYDQIAFKTARDVIEYADSAVPSTASSNAGVVGVYDAVLRSEDAALYAAERAGDDRSFETWRTYQLSDHLPMWVRLDVDDADEYLAGLAREE
jgi:endonuclease/exonuclease/phosphatase family metal-dependent hydrolase